MPVNQKTMLELLTSKVSFIKAIKLNKIVISLLIFILIASGCTTSKSLLFLLKPPTEAGIDLPYEYCIGIIDPKDPDNNKNTPIQVTVTTTPNTNWLSVEPLQTTQADSSCEAENVVAVLKGTPKEQDEIEVVLRATKGSAKGEQSFTIKVGDGNLAPRFRTKDVTVARVGKVYTYNMWAEDPEGEPVSFEKVGNLPNWLFLKDNGNGTATLTGAARESDVGKEHQVAIEARDGKPRDCQTEGCLKEFTIRVTDANTPPIFLSEPTAKAKIGNEYSYPIEVVDPDGDKLTIEITPAEEDWFEFDFTAKDDGTLTAEIKGVPDNEDRGKVEFTLVARETDFDEGGLSTEQSYTLYVLDPNNDNIPPKFTNISPLLTVKEGTNFVYEIVASDPDGEVADLTITAPTLPNWATITDNEDGTAVIRGVPNSKDIGERQVVVQVEDGNSIGIAVFTLAVENINEAPIFISEPTAGFTTDCKYFYPIETFDPDPNDELTISGTNIPDWTTLLANSDGTAILFSHKTPFENSELNSLGTDLVTLEVSDGKLSNEQEFSLIYDDTPAVGSNGCSINTPPEFESEPPVNVVIAEGEEYRYSVSAKDKDNDPLTLSAPSKPSWLSVSTSNDGGDNSITLTGTPNQSDVGKQQVILQVTDGLGSDVQALTIEVRNLNSLPSFTSEPTAAQKMAREDEEYAYPIVVNDEDGDVLVIGMSKGPSWLSVTNTGPGVGILSGTPSNEDVGTHEVTLFVSDGSNLTNSNLQNSSLTIQALGDDISIVEQSFEVTVENTNDPPEFISGPVESVNEGNNYLYNIITTDPDVEDTLTITTDNDLPRWLELTNTGNGLASLQGTPTQEHTGSHSISLRVSDGIESDIQNFAIAVIAINDDPVAVDDIATTDEDTAVSIAVLANDSDIDGDDLTIANISNPASGTAVLDPQNNQNIIYTPNENFVGEDSFIYTITDGNETDNATVTITVGGGTSGGGTNDPPVAVNDIATTNEDNPVSIQVLANDTDPDNDSLAVASFTSPANGTVVNNTTSLTYTPNSNFSGQDSFNYTVEDGNGGTDTATVNITVDPQNDLPVANDDGATTPEDADVTIDVLGNDSDVDGDNLTVSGITQPSNGTVTNNNTDVTYSPNTNFSGTDTFNYTINDGNGGTANAIVTVNVGGTNDNPVATADSATTNEDNPVIIQVLSNDSDPDGDDLNVASTTNPANGMVTNNGNNVIYTPDPDFNGTDTFDYTVEDGNGDTDTATVNITVDPQNDLPVANDDGATTPEDTDVTIDVLRNDTDVDGDNLTVSSVTQPSNGTVTNNGTDVTYSPNANFSGIDTFNYTVEDGNGGTANAIVSVDVGGTNDSPVANDDRATTNEDNPVIIQVLANDSDPDNDSLAVASFTNPANGMVTNNNGISVTYTPNSDFSGQDSFNYTIEDGNGGTDTAIVTITIDPQNDFPVANDDGATTPEDTAITIDVLGNDTDIDIGDTLVVTGVTPPLNGSVVNNNTNVTYTPNANFSGTDTFAYTASDGNGGTDTATVTISVGGINDPPTFTSAPVRTATEDQLYSYGITATDPDGDTLTFTATTKPAWLDLADNGNGTALLTGTPSNNDVGDHNVELEVGDGTATDTQIFNIRVSNSADAPFFTSNPPVTATQGTTYNYTATASDPDGDPLTFSVTNKPTWVSFTPATATLTGTPTNDDVGVHSVLLTVTDGNAGDAQSFIITVDNINDAPVAMDDTASTNEDNFITIEVLANDSDPDSDPFTITNVTNPANGTATNNTSSITYKPNDDFNGTDSFDYTIDDGNGGTDTATVTVTINAVNDAPSFTTTPPGTTSLINVNVGDFFTYNMSATDPDTNDTLSFTASTTNFPLSSWLTLTDNDDGTATLTGSPAFSDLGPLNVLLEVQDSVGENDTQSFTINANAIPEFTSNPITTADEGVLYTYNITTNDADLLGNNHLTITAPTLPSWLDPIVDNGDGTATLSGTPSSTDVGIHNVVLKVSDPVGANSQQNFDITVASVQAPVINSFTASANPIDLVAGMDTWTTTLTWDVKGTPPIDLNLFERVNGEVTSTWVVTGLTEKEVMPVGAPTTYTLNAGNIKGPGGSMNLDVVVNYPSSCTDPVNFTDNNLEEAIVTTLGLFPTQQVTCFEMWGLDGLIYRANVGFEISTMDGLQHAVNIKNIDFQNNFVKDFSYLQDFNSLQFLDLYNNSITDADLSSFPGLPNLQLLNLTGNQIVDINSFINLPNLPSLSILDLSANQITDISNFPTPSSLNVLNLYGNNIVDVGNFPTDFPNLGNLDLSDNLIVDIGNFPNLSLGTLDLSDNRIVNVSSFPNLSQLIDLDLSNNRIVNVSSFPNLQNLQTLYLSINQISDISSFPDLPNLQILDLDFNNITNISGLAGNNMSLSSGDILNLRTNCLQNPDSNSDVIDLRNRMVDVPTSGNPHGGCP